MELELHFRSNGANKYIQNILSKGRRIYILLYYTWNLPWIDHMLYNKINLNKFKIEIILSTFYDHNGVKLAVNNRMKTGKFTMCRN